MNMIALGLVGLVAFEHIYILVLEMFLWETRALKVFEMTAEYAASTKVLAMNQGLYNGFLAAGLLWGLFLIKDQDWKVNVINFFLGCIIVAGVYGGFTAKMSIILTQGLPAFLAILAINFLYKKG